MENSKNIRTQFYSRFLWHVISILNVFQAWIANLTSASATRAWLSAPTVASASTDWETHSHARVQKASPLNFPLLSLRIIWRSWIKLPSLKPFQFVKVCSPTTAVQWIQTHRTGNSTAYSAASTQPTAWDLLLFFHYDLGILAYKRWSSNKLFSFH